MVLTTLYGSLLTRLMAVFIVVLVVSPYSEPFATMNGTDFGGAGAVDVGTASKSKVSTQDVLVAPLALFVVLDVVATLVQPVERPAVLGPRHAQRAILRL